MGSVRNPFQEIADIQTQAIDRGLGEFQAGTQEAIGTIQSGVDEATALQDPFVQAGTDALDFFNALTGISGDTEAAVERFQSSPFAQILENQLEEAQQSATRQFSAAGQLQSGNFAKALQDVTAQKTQEGLLGFTDLLQSNINRGQQASTTSGSLLFQGAGQQAGLQSALAQASSEAEIAKGSAQAGQIANELASGLFKFRG